MRSAFIAMESARIASRSGKIGKRRTKTGERRPETVERSGKNGKGSVLIDRSFAFISPGPFLVETGSGRHGEGKTGNRKGSSLVQSGSGFIETASE
jgi:hypothetical protein